jgi:tripartite-type tricarboxylate transporter receptor subunit TctC
MAQKAGTQLTHVPYKGSAPAMNDVIGGQISMMFDIVNTARGHIASGRVRPIAMGSGKRNAALPEVPTFAEAGMPGFDVGGWFALFGPPKMPAALSTALHAATMKALASPELKKAYGDAGFEIWLASGEAVAKRTASERDMWATVTKGITVD